MTGTLKWKKYDIDIYLLMISNDVIMIKANAFRNGCFLRGTSLTGINFFGLGMYLWRQTWKDLWFFWKCNFFIHGSGVGTNEVQKTYGIRMVEKLGNQNILWKVYNARKKRKTYFWPNMYDDLIGLYTYPWQHWGLAQPWPSSLGPFLQRYKHTQRTKVWNTV